MRYEEMFDKVKAAAEGIDVSEITEHLAIQVDIIGEGAGIFYIEIKDGSLYIEPYDYVDHDAQFIVSAKDFIKIISGKLDPITAFTLGRLKVKGNFQKALLLKKIKF